ncbi:MAG TPA: type II secretion system protein [Candidatus Polarisedimenticolia bacterium]|nr:type II secretion system protein [Candidatus Polarisedimenticolia bacterium]
MKLLHFRHSPARARRAFTIIEIALCLGIIGFALVAIIAALPRGLDVQKRNREETIIGQNAEVWMNALRNGAQGDNDLTNYVLCITNFWTDYNGQFRVIKSGYDYYTPTSSVVTSSIYLNPAPAKDTVLLTNGLRIIGLLSMPKLMDDSLMPLPDYASPPYQSNYVVAYVRAFSGSAVSIAPQTNASILSDAFTYRMIVENFPYSEVDTNSFCLDCPAAKNLTADELAARTNLTRTVWMLQTNSHDFRLRFRWPVLPNGQIPNYGFLTFRSMASGILLRTNDLASPDQPLFFVQPSGYAEVTNTP